jgi:hypothetical protein
MSRVRIQFQDQILRWIKRAPVVQENWSPSLQTLEGHSSVVNAVAFSPDRQLLASGSSDRTVGALELKDGSVARHSRRSFRGGLQSSLSTGWPAAHLCSKGRHSQALGLKDGSVSRHSRGSLMGPQRSSLFTGQPAARLYYRWRHSQALGPKDENITQHSRGSFQMGPGSSLFTVRPATRLCITGQHNQALGYTDKGTSWKGSAGQGPAMSYETGTRLTGFSYVCKYQLATQVE